MKRFNALPEDNYGRVAISDWENTEAVCFIVADYHPYAVQIILDALNKAFPKIREDVIEIWKKRGVDLTKDEPFIPPLKAREIG